MWTYARAFKPLLPSSKRITLHAETEFFRSLNKNRLIGFIGSGVALPYGRLTWQELCALLIMDIDKRFWEVYLGSSSSSMMNEAVSLHKTLRIITSNKERLPYKDKDKLKKKPYKLAQTLDKLFSTSTSILELCSDLSTLLDKHEFSTDYECSDYLKERAACYLTQAALGQFGTRLKLVDGYGVNANENGKKSLYQEWESILEEFEEDTKEKSFVESLNIIPEKLTIIPKKDFISKWITKNKKAFKRKAIEELPWKLLIESLEDKDKRKRTLKDLALILKCASLADSKIEQIEWADPIKTIIDKLGINRLVTLNYDTELEKYFLKSKGYYEKENDHLLNNGGDTKVENIAIRSNGFGAKLTSVSLEKDLVGRLINFAAASKHNDSYIFHLHGRGDSAKDLILTEKDYQNLYVKSSRSRVAFSEGINTLFGGNDVVFLGVGMSETDLLQPLRQFVSESHNVSLRPDGILALLDEQDKAKKENKALSLHTEFGVKTIFYKPKTVSQLKEFNEIVGSKKDKTLSDRLKLMYLNRQLVGIQSKAFNAKLLKLAEKHQKWWLDWRKPPGKRAAKFINWNADVNKKNKGNKKTKLWIRQKVRLLDEGNKPEQSLDLYNNIAYNDIIDCIESINSNPMECKTPRVIMRYSGSEGVGKGTLVHSLQRYCEYKIDASDYVGCFFSDAKFSTEYTSVISALSRFLAGILAEWVIEDESKFKTEEEGKAFIEEAEKLETFNYTWVSKELKIKLPSGKTKILQKYLDVFSLRSKKRGGKSETNKSRILVCLSGLNRLVNKQGYAYNALHRDFFKILINPKNKDIPLSLILISGSPAVPIRYLSDVEEFKQSSDGSTDENKKNQWDSQTATLKHWRLIFKIAIKDRQWLPVCSSEQGVCATTPEELSKLSQSCDDQLGILPKNDDAPTRPSLAKVANDYLSVHLWLRLLLKAFKKSNSGINGDKQKELLDLLELAASRKEINGVVEKLLSIYDEFDTKPEKNLSLDTFQIILRHLALFSIPIERAVLANCPDVAKTIVKNRGGHPRQYSEKEISEEIEDYLQALNQSGLIIKIEQSGSLAYSCENKAPNYRYTLSSLMRKNLAQRMDFDAYTHGEFSFFDVSLFPTQPLDLPSPKERDFLFIGSILQNIISNARQSLELLNKENEANSKLDSIHSISRTIRAAVNLVNGSFSIGVVSRLEDITFRNIEYICGHAQPFEAYNRWLRCLSNIAVAIEYESEKLPNKMIQVPLYETEAAWIYNEQGLVNLIQGRLFDALQLFKLAKERLDGQPWVDTDDTESYPSLTSLRRVELNYAIAMLEAGRIKEAESEFSRLFRRKESNFRNKTSLTVFLACGYLGLCYHLQGRLTQAEERYKEALKYFKKENKNFLRVTAIFRLHYGNLKRGLNDYKKADFFLNVAIGAAASAKQMDVYHHACTSKAKLLLAKAEKGYALEAISLLDNAAVYAEKMGLFKLQVHADIIRGEVLIDQKQFTAAGKLLSNAIAISNKHGLRILKIRALQVYSKALAKRGTDQCVIDDISRTAKRLSENTGYLIKWVKDG